MTSEQTSRRAFLGAAGAFAVATQAGAATPARKVVRVAGRPARVIDVHGHCAFKEVEPVLAGTPLARTIQPLVIFGPQRIAEMDRRGIDVQVLTVNFFWWYEADDALADRIVRTHDEGLSRLAAANPGRLVGLSSVSLQNPELAARQLERAVREMGLKGASIGGHVKGESPTTPRYDPFWAKCQELDVPVFMHPNSAANIAREGAWAGRGGVDNIIGNPLETTVALHYLIFDGVLERHPDLKLLAVHGGGFLPAYSGRIDHAWGARKDSNGGLPRPPSEYLRRVYFDTVVFTPHQLKYLVETYGPDKIVMGTDYPYDMADYDPVQHVLSVDSFSDEVREKVAGGTARALLGL